MERDATISQGASAFLKDRLMDNSDKYKCYVCDICGWIAVQNKNTNENYCRSCQESGNNDATVSCIQIPYATKLLFQELTAMNIVPRMIVDKQ